MQKQELEQLKEEILEEVKPKAKRKKLSWNSAMMTGVLLLLSLVSVLQVIQSAAILSKIKSGVIKPANAGAPSGGNSLPSDINNLPNMVGGC